MNFNNINKTVNEELTRGKDRTALFQELCDKASAGQDKKIAFAIASVPIEQYRKDFTLTNIALCLLLVLNGVFAIFTELPVPAGENLILSFAKVLLPFFFCYFAYKFYGGIYRFTAIWALLELLETSVMTIATPPTNLILFKILVLFTTMAMSWYVARKVFPHLGVFSAKRDAQGNFLI